MNRYEYFDSGGKMIGYQAYNNLLNQWEYIDLRNENNSRYPKREYSKPKSPYDWDLIERGMRTVQERIDKNREIIQGKINEVEDALLYIIKKNGDLSKEQTKAYEKRFLKDLKKINNVDLSKNDQVKYTINWLDQWIEHIYSWEEK